MICNDVRRVIYFFLDGSVGDSRRRDIEIHLSHCPDCEIRIHVQQKLRAFVRGRLAPLAAPDRLRVRLSQCLRVAE